MHARVLARVEGAAGQRRADYESSESSCISHCTYEDDGDGCYACTGDASYCDSYIDCDGSICDGVR